MKSFAASAFVLLGLVLSIGLGGCEKPSAPAGTKEAPGTAAAPAKTIIRLGHFPNLTHAQALIARALSRKGKGWFESRLGPDVQIQWFTYNAGPSAMEAIFAKSIDVTYVGPSPALNAYMKSGGDEIRIIAGAARGGAALVVQGDDRIKAPADFRGRKVATPQLGNTQDVACRSWLLSQGFKVTQLGGDVSVLPTENPDQLSLFQQKELDAAWTVEPWVSRLELEAGGKVLVEEDSALTTILVSSVAFLKEKRELAAKFAQAHAELTDWIVKNPEESQQLLREELKAETTREVSEAIVKKAWKRLKFTKEIEAAPLAAYVARAKEVGFLKDLVDLSRLIEVLP